MSFVLVHSPLVGPQVWERVAAVLESRGHETVTPDVADDGSSPLWPQHAAAVASVIADGDVVVAHSGAGALVAAVRAVTGARPAAYVFVDAVLPSGGPRLEAMEREGGEWAAELWSHIATGGRYPTWSDTDLVDVLPDETDRRALFAQLRPRGMDYWTEALPLPEGWPDAPCGYLHWSLSYDRIAAEAEARGWRVVHRRAEHFELLVRPERVADDLLELARI